MSLRGKSREKLFEIWKKRLRVAKQVHEKKVIDWAKKVLHEYAGESEFNQETGEKYEQLAQVIQAIESTVRPHLLFSNPTVVAHAKRPDFEARERLVSAVVNHEYTDIKPSGHKIELENDLAVLDARLLPYGGTKTTYEVEGGILSEPQKPGIMDSIKGMFTGEQQKPIETPVIENEIGHKTERFNPLKVMLDYSAEHITKQKFVIEMMHVTKEQLERMRYEQDKIKNLDPDISLFPSYKARSEHEQDKMLNSPDFKGFTIYEIHDLENRVIHTMIDGVNDFIEFDSPYPLPEGSQYSFLWFIDVPNSVYPAPPIKFYRKRANEVSFVYSEVAKQVDKFMSKIGYNSDMLDKPEVDKLKSGAIGAAIAFKGNPNAGWGTINPQVSPDLFKYMAMTKELLFMESGSADFEISIPDNQRTATQDRITNTAVKSRRFVPQKMVKGFLVNQAHTIWMTLSENVTEERFVKILGENDAMEWWRDPQTGKNAWTRDDIAGDYWFDFDIESIAPQDKQSRLQQNAVNLETVMRPELKQGLLSEGKELILSEIFAKFADENMGIKDKSKLWRDLQGMEPGDEHTAWMNLQFPPISEREMKDPEFMMKHFQEHRKFINSPGFKLLPPEIQEQGIAHTETYLPYLAQLQASQPKQKSSAPVKRPEQPKEAMAGGEMI